MNKKKVSTILNLVNNQDEGESLAMQIKSEIKKVLGIKDNYPVLNENSLVETASPTLNDILVTISSKLLPEQLRDNSH